jgi:hypothetical protein
MPYADDKTFEACQGKLNFLPQKWKFWKTLSQYRMEWAFIKKVPLREAIVETNIAFDYMHSIYVWLEPKLTIEEGHKLICLILVSSIYEAVLNDIIGIYINEQAGKEVLFHRVSRFVSYMENIKILHEKGIINKNWKEYLKEICELRNFIHPAKKGTKAGISKISINDLKNQLDSFKNFIKSRY